MISDHSRDVADRAKKFYESQLRDKLEGEYLNKYVAIEPESQEYFIADTYADAVMQAHTKYPGRISFVLRVGHDAALHLGGMTR